MTFIVPLEDMKSSMRGGEFDPLSLEAVAEQSGLAQTTEYQNGSNLGRRLARIGAVGLAAAGASYGIYALANPPGLVESYDPPTAAIHSSKAETDGQLRVGTWNMHDEAAQRASQIIRFAAKERLDVVALQEVSRNDAFKLRYLMPGWHQAFVLADVNQRPLEGGYGNMLLSRVHMRNKDSTVMRGTGPIDAVTGVTTIANEDIWQGKSLGNVTDGRQENRAALAETVDVQVGNEKHAIRIITAHIAAGVKYPQIHKEQMSGLLKFINRNVKDGRPVVFCGDLNATDTEVVPAFAGIRMIGDYSAVATTVKANPADSRKIDQCGYIPAGLLGLPTTRVVREFKSDHYAKVVTFKQTAAQK